VIARLLVLLVRGWQIGPSAILPPTCRYDPSCSAYAITALRRYGALKGGWLAMKRIARCHPWGGYGPDPVPGPDALTTHPGTFPIEDPKMGSETP
jgi:putative membrane protein insertion efficiency factor